MSLKEEILKLKELGFSYTEISKTLNCSKGTISFHCNEGVRNRSLLRQSCRRRGLKITPLRPLRIPRSCANCGLNLEKKRSSAKYCNRTCQHDALSKAVFARINTDPTNLPLHIQQKEGWVQRACEHCNKIYLGKKSDTRKRFCSIECSSKNKRSTKEKREALTENISNRRRQLKMQAVTHLGGKCSVCGYDKYQGSLEFHHVDPSKKESALSKLFCRPWSIIASELEKCVLLCANCHREVHAGITKI